MRLQNVRQRFMALRATPEDERPRLTGALSLFENSETKRNGRLKSGLAGAERNLRLVLTARETK